MTQGGTRPLSLAAGVDEAGRGPWAGPVVAAAVILGDVVPDGLTDSKRLSATKRERLFEDIMKHALAVSFRSVSPRRIDRIDILRATLVAMRESVMTLPIAPSIVYVDGKQTIPGLHVPQRALVGGDGVCPSVSAASIVAKVVRDRMMHAWDEVYPEYGFAQNKGYGTRQHVAALNDFGPCPLHRFSFAPVQRVVSLTKEQERVASMSK